MADPPVPIWAVRDYRPNTFRYRMCFKRLFGRGLDTALSVVLRRKRPCRRQQPLRSHRRSEHVGLERVAGAPPAIPQSPPATSKRQCLNGTAHADSPSSSSVNTLVAALQNYPAACSRTTSPSVFAVVQNRPHISTSARRLSNENRLDGRRSPLVSDRLSERHSDNFAPICRASGCPIAECGSESVHASFDVLACMTIFDIGTPRHRPGNTGAAGSGLPLCLIPTGARHRAPPTNSRSPERRRGRKRIQSQPFVAQPQRDGVTRDD